MYFHNRGVVIQVTSFTILCLVYNLQSSVSDLLCLRYKDGCEIQPGDNITLQAEGTMRRLIIRSAEASDAGSYTCRAGNNSIDFTVNVRGTRTFPTPVGSSTV